MSIRSAQLGDLNAIQLLSKELVYEDMPYAVAKRQLEVLLSSKSDRLWLWEEEAQIKGWIHVFIAHRVASPSFVEIGGLVVSSAFRRNGIGRSLVEYAVVWAKANEMKIRVRCSTKRIETHHFYTSMGFDHIKSQYIFELL